MSVAVARAVADRRAFAVHFSSLDRWDVASFRTVDWRWPADVLRPIGEVLDQRREPVDKSGDLESVPIIAKVSFGGDVSVRPPEQRRGYKGRLYWADAGDLIYSKIRVKQGSISVVPDDLGRIAVSAEYPVFKVDRERLDGRYLELVVRSRPFLDYLDGLAHGGATKTRIPPELFEGVTIPVPPLVVQRAIVATWTEARAEAAAVRQRAAAAERQAETDFLRALGLSRPTRAAPPRAFAVRWSELDRWGVGFNQLAGTGIDFSKGTFPAVPLGEAAAVSYGIQKSPANRPGVHARPYLRVANVQRGTLDLSEIKTINVPDDELPRYLLEEGDILFVEGNGSREELGRCAIWDGSIPECVHQNHLLKVRLSDGVLPEYAMRWFNTEAGKEHFFHHVKTSSGLGTINSTELKAAPLPLPPPAVQRELVESTEATLSRAASLRGEAARRLARARAAVEAMILGARPVPQS